MSSPDPVNCVASLAVPGRSALYDVSARGLTALHSSFLQTVGNPSALASASTPTTVFTVTGFTYRGLALHNSRPCRAYTIRSRGLGLAWMQAIPAGIVSTAEIRLNAGWKSAMPAKVSMK